VDGLPESVRDLLEWVGHDRPEQNQ
jgi:hypothetical protein